MSTDTVIDRLLDQIKEHKPERTSPERTRRAHMKRVEQGDGVATCRACGVEFCRVPGTRNVAQFCYGGRSTADGVASPRDSACSHKTQWRKERFKDPAYRAKKREQDRESANRRPAVLCSNPACKEETACPRKGLCNACYWHARKHGAVRTAEHVELHRTRLAARTWEACAHCGQLSKRRRLGYCWTCYDYHRRHGVHRPRENFTRLAKANISGRPRPAAPRDRTPKDKLGADRPLSVEAKKMVTCLRCDARFMGSAGNRLCEKCQPRSTAAWNV